MAAEHVIPPPEIGRSVHYRDGRGLLHHADQSRITPWIATDATGLFLGQVPAFLARTDPLGDGGQDGREPFDLFRGLLE